jgi:hypothetical protein
VFHRAYQALCYWVANVAASWRAHPTLLFLELTGTASSMLAASFLARQIGAVFTLRLFWLYGSVALTFSSLVRHNSSMAALMLFYTVLNLITLWSFR